MDEPVNERRGGPEEEAELRASQEIISPPGGPETALAPRHMRRGMHGLSRVGADAHCLTRDVQHLEVLVVRTTATDANSIR